MCGCYCNPLARVTLGAGSPSFLVNRALLLSGTVYSFFSHKNWGFSTLFPIFYAALYKQLWGGVFVRAQGNSNREEPPSGSVNKPLLLLVVVVVVLIHLIIITIIIIIINNNNNRNNACPLKYITNVTESEVYKSWKSHKLFTVII